MGHLEITGTCGPSLSHLPQLNIQFGLKAFLRFEDKCKPIFFLYLSLTNFVPRLIIHLSWYTSLTVAFVSGVGVATSRVIAIYL